MTRLTLFNVSSFLDLYARIKKDYAHKNLESLLKKKHSSALERFSHPPISLSFTEVILTSSTPITEEHTKLLDRLSEPSSRLIHCVSHPPEEDVSAEVVTACFICIRVHGFASCIPTFCKKDLSVISTAEKLSWK